MSATGVECRRTRLADLGERIVILGPSCSGKSTLAAAIERARGMPAVHLDRLRHLPGTAFELRDDDEFARLHAEAIRGERWAMDGNYSALLPARLERATGVILLDISLARSLARYVRRTRHGAPHRAGGLGAPETLSREMIAYQLRNSRRNRARRRRLVDGLPTPALVLAGPRALRELSAREGLELG